MNSSHITDEVLQAFLLKEIDNETITKHLAECSACQKRLDEYQYLIDGVQKIEPETFLFDAVPLAMNTIMLYEKKKRKKQELMFWGLLSVLLIAISATSIPYLPALLAIFTSKSVFTTLLVTGTGLVVLLFLLADILRQYKKKEEKIFNNNLQPIF